tara:strand:- start:708 stop:977 length:270 start_codon:yes stop_codon:yes gene_type:complete
MMLTLASIVCLGATGVAAQVSNDTDETEKAAATDDSQVIKCERQAVTGSRARKKRVCLTVAEWQARRDGGQRSADALLQDASRGFPVNN